MCYLVACIEGQIEGPATDAAGKIDFGIHTGPGIKRRVPCQRNGAQVHPGIGGVDCAGDTHPTRGHRIQSTGKRAAVGGIVSYSGQARIEKTGILVDRIDGPLEGYRMGLIKCNQVFKRYVARKRYRPGRTAIVLMQGEGIIAAAVRHRSNVDRPATAF